MDVYTWNVVWIAYGDEWRRCRRLLHEFLNLKVVSRFDDYVTKHTRRFLSQLAETPDDFLDHTQLYVPLRSIVVVCFKLTSISSVTGALTMETTYGMDIKSHEDKFLQAAELAMGHLEKAATPGAFLVDTFPIRMLF